MKRHEFKATDDKSALKGARPYVIGSPVEVWQGERLIGTLQPDSQHRLP